MANAGSLATSLRNTVVAGLRDVEASAAPRFELPALYGGHPVLDDTAADLVYVLGLLIEAGTEEVAGCDLRDAGVRLLKGLDPEGVEAFASYRVGETVQRLGGLGALPADLREHVLAAVETPKTMAQLDERGRIPPNYAVVAARVLLAEARLRGAAEGDDPRLARFVDRARGMLSSQPDGWIDDGMDAWVHYDIYTPDMYLFAEPLSPQLGPTWAEGLRRVLADLDHLILPGGAVVWGRSVGALGLAMTIELAAMSVGRDIGDADLQQRWLRRAFDARRDLDAWFRRGVIAAHQGRATMPYRGPARRLQMTFDIYGKLLLAAGELERRPDVAAANDADSWAAVDRLFVLDADKHAALWAHRGHPLRFVLPIMCGFSSDYLPSPRAPGLFEQPTSGPPTLLPSVLLGGTEQARPTVLVPAALPTSLSHHDGRLTLAHTGWAPVASATPDEHWLDGGRRATYTVDGRSLVVDEELWIDQAADATITLAIPETPDRPLDVAVTGTGHRVTTVDTSGLAEWRSFWGPLPRVHEIEIDTTDDTCHDARRSVSFTWRVTPRLRVASTISGHAYDRALYAPMGERVATLATGAADEDLARRLRDVDILHLAWPEWWTGVDPDHTAEVLDVIRGVGTRVVWTQHNLVPHLFKTPEASRCYQLWAEAADGVIHHTSAGMDVARATYRYGPETTHVVIPHGHWGERYRHLDRTSREQVETDEGWAPCALRLAVIGAPRTEKDLQLVVDAVARSTRPDVQLIVRIDEAVDVPADVRIVPERGHVEEHRYHRRLAAYDALVLPFAPAGMLTTGTAFDSIGAGVPAITSDWSFFDETFKGADIRYGSTVSDLAATIDSLTSDDLERARLATLALQPDYEWATIADRTYTFLDDIARD